MTFLLRSLPWCLLCSCFCAVPAVRSQTLEVPSTDVQWFGPPPVPPFLPGDVLNPDKRQNTPAIKVGTRVGFNRSSYTNDRYLDNVALDVGRTSGETDIYTSGAGFGLQGGIDVEYPLNTGFSLLGTAEFDYIHFSASGAVEELSRNASGDTVLASSVHSFTASINYIKIAGSAKLNFSSFYTVFGLVAAAPLSTSLKRERAFGDASFKYPGTGTHQLVDEGEIPDPTGAHYSLRMAAGLVYQIDDRLQFSPELTLDFGFNAINKSRESDLGVYGINAVLRYDL